MRPPGRVTGSGRTVRCSSPWPCGQRGWKAQPVGRRSSDGARPGMPLEDALVLEVGQAVDQRLRIGVLGVGEHLARCSDLDQPPGIHHRHPVDELGHQAHVVADQDDGGVDLALDLVDRLHHLALGHHVERAGRLVGDDDLRRRAGCRWRCRRAASCRPRARGHTCGRRRDRDRPSAARARSGPRWPRATRP